MNQQRSRVLKPGAIFRMRAKALAAATVMLAVGLVAITISHGLLSAVAFASVSAVLLLQLALSWKQSRLDTERFQQLRNRADKLTKQLVKIESAVENVRTASANRTVPVAASTSPQTQRPIGSQQMTDLQRELDYLLWRISSTRTDVPAAGVRSPTGALTNAEEEGIR